MDYATLTYSTKLHQAKHEISPEQTGSGLFKAVRKAACVRGRCRWTARQRHPPLTAITELVRFWQFMIDNPGIIDHALVRTSSLDMKMGNEECGKASTFTLSVLGH